MHHMTHNYMLGLAVLVFAFIFFYTPMVYAFLAIRKQQKRIVGCLTLRCLNKRYKQRREN